MDILLAIKKGAALTNAYVDLHQREPSDLDAFHEGGRQIVTSSFVCIFVLPKACIQTAKPDYIGTAPVIHQLRTSQQVQLLRPPSGGGSLDGVSASSARHAISGIPFRRHNPTNTKKKNPPPVIERGECLPDGMPRAVDRHRSPSRCPLSGFAIPRSKTPYGPAADGVRRQIATYSAAVGQLPHKDECEDRIVW